MSHQRTTMIHLSQRLGTFLFPPFDPLFSRTIPDSWWCIHLDKITQKDAKYFGKFLISKCVYGWISLFLPGGSIFWLWWFSYRAPLYKNLANNTNQYIYVPVSCWGNADFSLDREVDQTDFKNGHFDKTQ